MWKRLSILILSLAVLANMMIFRPIATYANVGLFWGTYTIGNLKLYLMNSHKGYVDRNSPTTYIKFSC